MAIRTNQSPSGTVVSVWRIRTPNKTLHWPPGVSVTELAVTTSAPDTGASELNRYVVSGMTKILFVCSQNRLRSPTAETIFSQYEGVEAIGAGTNADAATPVTGDLVEWADVILVMEKSHRNKISKKFHEQLKNKKIGVLEIPDIYDYMEPVLVQLLENKVPRYVRI